MIAPCVISPASLPRWPSTRTHSEFIGDCMQSAIPELRASGPRRDWSQAVCGPGDGLAGGRRGEREGRVVVGEVDVPAGVAGLQELRAGGDRDVRAARLLGVLELQRGLPADGGRLPLDQLILCAADLAGQLAQGAERAERTRGRALRA